MNYLQHPLSADKLLNHAWRGHRGDGGPEVIVGTYLSAKYPGFIHYEVCDMGTQQRVWSKRPATPDFVLGAIDHELKPLGLCVAKLRWRYSANKPHDWDTHKRVMDAPGQFVYFLSAGPFIKVGRTTGKPDKRINELQTGCPYPITLAAHVAGGSKKEAELHRLFAAHRVRENGEWFHRAPEIEAFMAEASK